MVQVGTETDSTGNFIFPLSAYEHLYYPEGILVSEHFFVRTELSTGEEINFQFKYYNREIHPSLIDYWDADTISYPYTPADSGVTIIADLSYPLYIPFPENSSCEMFCEVMEPGVKTMSRGVKNRRNSGEIEWDSLTNSLVVLPTEKCDLHIWMVYSCPDECMHIFKFTIKNSNCIPDPLPCGIVYENLDYYFNTPHQGATQGDFLVADTNFNNITRITYRQISPLYQPKSFVSKYKGDTNIVFWSMILPCYCDSVTLSIEICTYITSLEIFRSSPSDPDEEFYGYETICCDTLTINNYYSPCYRCLRV